MEKAGRDDHGVGRSECAYFVFQAVEVDPGFPAYGRIDGSEEGGGHINEVYASFETGGSKSAQIGNHASAQIDEERFAGGLVAAEFVPHLSQCLQGFVGVAGFDGDDSCRGRNVFRNLGQRQFPGMGVAEDKEGVESEAVERFFKGLAGLGGE